MSTDLHSALNAARSLLVALGPRPEGDPDGMRRLAGSIEAEAETVATAARVERGLPDDMVFEGPAATRVRAHAAQVALALTTQQTKLDRLAEHLRTAAGQLERSQHEHDRAVRDVHARIDSIARQIRQVGA